MRRAPSDATAACAASASDACELGRGSFVSGRLVFDATGNVSVRGC